MGAKQVSLPNHLSLLLSCVLLLLQCTLLLLTLHLIGRAKCNPIGVRRCVCLSGIVRKDVASVCLCLCDAGCSSDVLSLCVCPLSVCLFVWHSY